jgi:hypothetical protein
MKLICRLATMSSPPAKEQYSVRTSYGIGGAATDDFGRRCLLARRLVEKGVRFNLRGVRRPRRFPMGRPSGHRGRIVVIPTLLIGLMIVA